MVTATAITRIFNFNGRNFPDPNPAISPEEVKRYYANLHPELLNAAVEGGEFESDVQEFRFIRAVGSKG